MKTYKNIITLILIPLFLFSCGNDDVDEFKNTRSINDVKNDFKTLNFDKGVNDIEIEGSFSNVIWRFRVIVPESVSESNKRPLIVCLHGGTSIIDPDIHKNTSCLEEPGFEEIDTVLLCPNSEGFSWAGIPEQEKILALTSLIQTKVPIDENKVAIMGYSDGGNGAWFYAEKYPDVFTAAIPISSSYNFLNPNININISVPLYVIHGESDELFPLENMVEVVDKYRELGTDVTFSIAEGLGHFNPCLYTSYLKEGAKWLVEDVWN